MLNGRKYVLGLNSGIIFGNTSYPAEANLSGVIEGNPDGLGMLVHLEDVAIDPVIVMDRKQAKELIKALKVAIRRNRKWKKQQCTL